MRDRVLFSQLILWELTRRYGARFCSKMASRQKERALTSPKTSALAFISVLPWRINDGLILTACKRR